VEKKDDLKIWFDLCNSPHVPFFANYIREKKVNNNAIITCRPLANTVDLLDLYDFKYKIVGKHYGKSLIKKILGFPIRVLKLYQMLRPLKIDAAISHSSFYSPIVSKMLGVPCLYLNDNEHAQGNRLAFIFADKIMVPEYIDIELVIKQGAAIDKIIRYPGIKEGVYLWDFEPVNQNGSNKNVKDNKKIFIRPEPVTAQYYNGKHNFLDQLLIELKEKYYVTLLPRSNTQRVYYKKEIFKGINVAEETIALEKIVPLCDLFIGAGGTMTREASVIGIPTISIYQDELLGVDKYLIDKGFMVHKKNLTSKFVDEFMKISIKKEINNKLMEKGKQAYLLIKDETNEFGINER
jgi:predicted glycosyltransferase